MSTFASLMESAQREDPRAKFLLGQYFEEGQEGSQKNPGQALQWYTKAAYNGETDALFRAAYCYEHGIGTVPNIKGAEDWYTAAANKGHLEAQFHLAELYTRGGAGVAKNPKAAFDLYLKAAYASHTPSTRRVGECLMKGEGCQATAEGASMWLETAAKNGDAKSTIRLAELYSSGSGADFPADAEKAFGWWMTAATAVEGSIDVIDKSLAEYKVAEALLSGKGTEKNIKVGMQWLLQSAQEGHPEAMHVYAKSLNNPPSSEIVKDTGHAMEWLEKAATAGWPESLLSLGNAHQYGMYGKVVDFEQAFYFYEKAGMFLFVLFFFFLFCASRCFLYVDECGR
jgi:TPR repeat protein